jgi:hypothetical protein
MDEIHERAHSDPYVHPLVRSAEATTIAPMSAT